MQKLLNGTKKVAKFIFIVILKLFEGPKQESIAVEANKKKSGSLIKLVRAISNGISSRITRNSQKFKEEVDPREIKAPTERKTWARVKQDFKEWYAALEKEFDEKHNPELPKEIEEAQESKKQ